MVLLAMTGLVLLIARQTWRTHSARPTALERENRGAPAIGPPSTHRASAHGGACFWPWWRVGVSGLARWLSAGLVRTSQSANRRSWT